MSRARRELKSWREQRFWASRSQTPVPSYASKRHKREHSSFSFSYIAIVSSLSFSSILSILDVCGKRMANKTMYWKNSKVEMATSSKQAGWMIYLKASSITIQPLVPVIGSSDTSSSSTQNNLHLPFFSSRIPSFSVLGCGSTQMQNSNANANFGWKYAY